ncbi:MAG: hypothetical protein PUI85_00640 [Eubacteriales bacterium]|nr:hypothetical protein [Eubacteriales bacterium]MDY3333096.1 hypothetical protein [Gallibacter sp.]
MEIKKILLSTTMILAMMFSLVSPAFANQEVEELFVEIKFTSQVNDEIIDLPELEKYNDAFNLLQVKITRNEGKYIIKSEAFNSFKDTTPIRGGFEFTGWKVIANIDNESTKETNDVLILDNYDFTNLMLKSEYANPAGKLHIRQLVFVAKWKETSSEQPQVDPGDNGENKQGEEPQVNLGDNNENKPGAENPQNKPEIPGNDTDNEDFVKPENNDKANILSIIKNTADLTWNKGTKVPTIIASGDANQLKEILFDGKVVDKKNYKIVSGSTELTFDGTWLSKQKAGKHIVSFVCNDGSKVSTS